jgi:predicted alpha/beta hydrolase family esterase
LSTKLIERLVTFRLDSAQRIAAKGPLPNNGTPDLGRRKQISHEISASEDNAILVGHSLGASMLLACLSEIKIRNKIAGIFLLASPF